LDEQVHGDPHHAVSSFASENGPEDRNDIMQGVLLHLWKAIPFFRNDSQPSTFIYRIAHNTTMAWHKKETQTRRLPAFGPQNFEPIQPASIESSVRLLRYAVPFCCSISTR